MARFPRVLAWRRENADTIDLLSGFVLIVCAAGLLTLGGITYFQSRHDGRIARRSCERTVKFGPYLANIYEREFTRPDGTTFRLMPVAAARAYRESIPKHC